MAKSKIYIKPSKRGTFTAAAKRRGKSVQGFASQVLANKGNYSPAMVKKANFARNAAKWKKEYGGEIPQYSLGGDIFQGAASGASAGAALGPWGMAGGAVIGAAGGWLGNKSAEEAEQNAKQQAVTNQIRESRLANLDPQQQYASVLGYKYGGMVPSYDNGGPVELGEVTVTADKFKKKASEWNKKVDKYLEDKKKYEKDLAAYQDSVAVYNKTKKTFEDLAEKDKQYWIDYANDNIDFWKNEDGPSKQDQIDYWKSYAKEVKNRPIETYEEAIEKQKSSYGLYPFDSQISSYFPKEFGYSQSNKIQPISDVRIGSMQATAPVYTKPGKPPVAPAKPEGQPKYDTKFKDMKMRSLWATNLKKDPNTIIGTLNPLDTKFEKGFTIQEALETFPQEVLDKYGMSQYKEKFQDGGIKESIQKRTSENIPATGYSTDPKMIMESLGNFIMGNKYTKKLQELQSNPENFTEEEAEKIKKDFNIQFPAIDQEMFKFSLGQVPEDELQNWEPSPYMPGSYQMKGVEPDPKWVTDMINMIKKSGGDTKHFEDAAGLSMQMGYMDPYAKFEGSLGEDEKGKYFSMKDTFDLNNPLANYFLDKEVPLYNRYYYKENEGYDPTKEESFNWQQKRIKDIDKEITDMFNSGKEITEEDSKIINALEFEKEQWNKEMQKFIPQYNIEPTTKSMEMKQPENKPNFKYGGKVKYEEGGEKGYDHEAYLSKITDKLATGNKYAKNLDRLDAFLWDQYLGGGEQGYEDWTDDQKQTFVMRHDLLKDIPSNKKQIREQQNVNEMKYLNSIMGRLDPFMTSENVETLSKSNWNPVNIKKKIDLVKEMPYYKSDLDSIQKYLPDFYDKYNLEMAEPFLKEGEIEYKNGGMIRKKRGAVTKPRTRYMYGGKHYMQQGGFMPNAELEGGESFETPQGQNFNVQGPSHEQGGVDLALQEGTRVYSDKLKKPGTKKTYSDLNKKLTNKISMYQDALDNPNATNVQRRTAERMLAKLEGQQNDLFIDQERLKYKKGMRKNTKKMQTGGLFGRGPYGINTMRDDLNAERLGLPVGAVMGSEYSEMLRKKQPTANIQQTTPDVSFAENPMGIEPWMLTGEGMAGIDTPVEAKPSVIGKYTTGNNTEVIPDAPAKQGMFSSANLGSTVSAIGALAPALVNIGEGLFGKAEQENPADFQNILGITAANRLRDRKYNVRPQLDAARRAFAQGKRNLTSAARTRGELLSGLGGLATRRAETESGIFAQKQNIENQYQSEAAGMLGGLGSEALATRMNLAQQNAANRAAQRNIMRAGLGQVSQFAQIQQQMANQRMRDEELLKLIPSLAPSFTYDRQSGINFNIG